MEHDQPASEDDNLSEELEEYWEDVGFFVEETNESLVALSKDIIALENNSDIDILNNIFRTFHSIKGSAGSLNLERIVGVAHQAEDLLGAIRQDPNFIDQPTVTLLLSVFDALSAMTQSLSTKKSEGENQYTALIQDIESCLTKFVDHNNQSDQLVGEIADKLEASYHGDPPSSIIQILFDLGYLSSDNMSFVITKQAVMPGTPITEILTTFDLVDPQALKIIVALVSEINPGVIEQKKEKTKHTAKKTYIKVDNDIFTRLNDLNDSITSTYNFIAHNLDRLENKHVEQIAEIIKVTSIQLHSEISRAKLQPINTLWDSFHRLVREVSGACGKKVVLKTSGDDTQVGKNLLDALKDPLMHMLRNSIDHGIETPSERETTGKDPSGTISLNAWIEDRSIYITIDDDGKGIDPDKIASIALKKKIVTQTEVENMQDTQKIRLITTPGFSTAETVTDISGRGVGMDVVRCNIESVEGSLTIKSILGEGSQFMIRLPQVNDSPVFLSDAEHVDFFDF